MLAGHDFLVAPDQLTSLGYLPSSLEDGLLAADALVLLTDHPGYASMDATSVASLMQPPAIIFDLWGVASDQFEGNDKITYLRWGRG